MATPTACTTSVVSNKRRRSVVSATTPAGKASTNMGRKTAVCTSATTNADACSSTIIQAAAMAIMPLAVKYPKLAPHMPRNGLSWSTVQMLAGGGAELMGANLLGLGRRCDSGANAAVKKVSTLQHDASVCQPGAEHECCAEQPLLPNGP